MKKKIVFVLLVMLSLTMVSCESWQRSMKSFKSDVAGGLERKVEVYDYNGNILKEYQGKFDIEESEGGKIMFDKDGKRVQIYNAIVIAEEQ